MVTTNDISFLVCQLLWLLKQVQSACKIKCLGDASLMS